MVDLVAKHVVGAHYGLRDWLVQRVTAIVMIAWLAVFLGCLLWHGGFEHATWRALWASAAFRLLSFAFMVAVLWHAWVGVRNIAMDYLKPVWLRLTFQCVVIALLVVYLGWTIQVLWGVGGR
jgi:succinate dehydrogenase / fumarate reductase membrane anchor subunit